MSNKKVLIYSILMVITILIVGIGTAYAWFNTTIEGDSVEVKVTTAVIGPLKYTGTELTAENVLPGWISEDLELKVEGVVKGIVDAEYYCVIQNRGEVTDIEYRISKDGESDSTSGSWTSISSSKIVSGNITEENGSDVYKIGIRFKETGLDQNSQQNKTLSVSISCYDDLTLGNAILLDNANVKTRDSFKSTNVESNTIYEETYTQNSEELTTYYFAGAVTNNYVKFGTDSSGNDLIWRIIRINENGSIKLLLEEGINNNTFYPYKAAPCNSYVYMYYSNSNVKQTVDSWYTGTLKTNYESYIATTNFCEAAKVKVYSDYVSGNATMTITTSYVPNFECSMDGNGKQYVTSKVGLITADEAAMAGLPLYYEGLYGSGNEVKNTYLQKDYIWWTMSPAGTIPSNSVAASWAVTDKGYVHNDSVYDAEKVAVRPVISLKSCITWKSGDGTTDSPYEVELSDECASQEN